MGNSGPDAAISQATVARLTQVEGAITTLKDGLEMVGDRESKAEGHLAAPEQAKPGEGQVIRDAFQQQSQEITAVRDLVHQFELIQSLPLSPRRCAARWMRYSTRYLTSRQRLLA